jgi:hypothetical protein
LVKQGGTSSTFVSEGIESALPSPGKPPARVTSRSPTPRTWSTSASPAGLLDEIQLNIVPLLLAGGVHLFYRLRTGPIELEQVRVVASPTVTHLKFRVAR